MADPSASPGTTNATLSAYSESTREMLVPLLMYKSVFLGEWFQALVNDTRDADIKRALLSMNKETLREAIELLTAARAWDEIPAAREAARATSDALQRRLLHELLALKEGSTEAIVLTAMRAPTEDLRQRLLELADLDRIHADDMRSLLGLKGVREALDRQPESEDIREVGARVAAKDRTLGAQVQDDIDALTAAAEQPDRLIVSHMALRRLRDEGHMRDNGTAFDLLVEVDFGWEGPCYSIATEARVRLAEIISASKADVPDRLRS